MRNNTQKPEGFIDRSPAGFSKRQGFSVSTAYKEIKAGRLKAKKVGTRTFISEQAESDWINSLEDYPTTA